MTTYASRSRQPTRPTWATAPTTLNPTVHMGAELHGDTSYLSTYRDPVAAIEARRIARTVFETPAQEVRAMARIGALHGQAPPRQPNRYDIPTTHNMSALRQAYIPYYAGGHAPNNDVTQNMPLHQDGPPTHTMAPVQFRPDQVHHTHPYAA